MWDIVWYRESAIEVIEILQFSNKGWTTHASSFSIMFSEILHGTPIRIDSITTTLDK